MKPALHVLTTLSTYFKVMVDNNKLFELRKDDRGFEIGDHLILAEKEAGYYTGFIIHAKITCILRNFNGLEKGYCILGLSKDLEVKRLHSMSNVFYKEDFININIEGVWREITI